MTDEQLLKTFDTMRSGLYIVTSAYRRKPAGCTCTWVTRASFQPPMIAVYLQPNRHTLSVVEQGKRFCVNILGESGLQLARRFGYVSGMDEDKFGDVSYTNSPGGSPLLDIAVGYIDCKLTQVVAVGDHQLAVGQVVAAALASNEPPLVYNPETFYSTGGFREESAGGSGE